jgi:hypothetical protein
MDDPLAGCLPIIHYGGNAETFLGSILVRLRIFHKEAVCTQLSDMIIEESADYPGFRYEYIINEVIYEMRLARQGKDEMYEKVILDSWIKKLMKVDQDSVLEFVSRLGRDREKRSKFKL